MLLLPCCPPLRRVDIAEPLLLTDSLAWELLPGLQERRLAVDWVNERSQMLNGRKGQELFIVKVS